MHYEYNNKSSCYYILWLCNILYDTYIDLILQL